MVRPTLLAVPNFSEGRSTQTIAAINDAFAGTRLLDVHSDADHHRSVFTLAGEQGRLVEPLLRAARVAAEHIDVVARDRGDPAVAGQHPHVGALDVAPIVYLGADDRGAACAEALALADRIAGELDVPVFLYGELSAQDAGEERTRSQLRRGGVSGLAARISQSAPDFGPAHLHPSAGATLVAARQPLVAFNLQLAPPAELDGARRIAALIREGGEEGLPGLRAIGVTLAGGVAQVSTNVERPIELPLAAVVAAVRRHAAIASAELVGLAPSVAMHEFPDDVPIGGFDPERHLIENALGC